ncbi:MAG: hypothetical protein US49_C0005G0050 [candidate division TM6 bacterium GW2011_GWF2_37_49]|nr:MAG: hypothetical protein US49_C0005G0050 [candidate division TM6 bacterium GW2011_GWF2_37_49]
MKRIIDYYLAEWKNSEFRKPLLLRGARQVGKTHAVRELAKLFDNFVEINFEADAEVKDIFDRDLDPVRISRALSLITGKSIEPGKTLLFFDEIQGVPKALTALRYFYEKLPTQHIIAAGSLLDFTTQSVGIPVGRVSSLYMYPVSFFEFLCECGHTLLAQEILSHSIEASMSEPVHRKLLAILAEYLAIGGMPEAVALWQIKRDPLLCLQVHDSLISTYRQDFGKYAKSFQLKYVEALFNAIPRQLGTKFKYNAIDGDYRKRELAPCLDLLTTAGIIHPILRSAGNGIPLGAEVDPGDFKTIFLDVALSQAILGLDLKTWFLHPDQDFVNKGALIESFVGQELLAYAHPAKKENLFYWRRNASGSEAEVDYIIQANRQVVPVEVKSGLGSTLKSMHMFLDSHQQSTHGIRFSTHNYSEHANIQSYPLYAIAHVILGNQMAEKKAYEALVEP